jgi:tetratricopeptide (TPR) repeat protein/cold shock CspA family protein
MEALPESTEQDPRHLCNQALPLEQAGQFRDAALLYRQSYLLQPTALAAGGYLRCARKQGSHQAREAVEFAREPLRRWPDDESPVREYVWAVYEGYLGHGASAVLEREGAGFQTKVTAARRILEMSPDEMLRRLTVFAICREAGMCGRWDLVLDFARCLDGEQLPARAVGLPGHSRLSDQQRWFYLVTRAHLELGDNDACIETALDASRRFPDDVFFRWWRALALVRRGSTEEGLGELLQVNRRFPPQWAIRRDIAEAYQRSERYEDAWRWFCEAAAAPGDLKERIPMLTGMAHLLERMAKWPLAYDHLLLAWALAARGAGWETLADRQRGRVAGFLEHHAKRLDEPADPPDAPPDLEAILTRCRGTWTETLKQSLPRGTGYIRMFDPENGIGYIQSEDGTDVFFGQSSFKGHGVEPAIGMRVEFFLKEPYDTTKGRESLSAVHVFPAKRPW